MARGQGGSEADGAPVILHIARPESTAEVRGSHLALAEGGVKATLAGQGGLSAAAFTTKGDPGQKPAVGAALSWRRAGLPLGLRAGWIGERETLLGSVGEGAFGDLAGDTAFVGVDASTDLGRLAGRRQRGARRGRPGHARRPPHPGVLARHQRVRASCHPGAGRFRSVAVFHVTAVAGGERPGIVDGAGRPDQDGRVVVRRGFPADLLPSGRQMDIAGQWHGPLGKGELRLGAVYSHRPGHNEAANPELTFLGGWRRDF